MFDHLILRYSKYLRAVWRANVSLNRIDEFVRHFLLQLKMRALGLLFSLAFAERSPLEARDGAFWLDGEKITLVSGSIHYFRVPNEYWLGTDHPRALICRQLPR